MYFFTLLQILIAMKTTFGIDRTRFFEGTTDTVLTKDEAYLDAQLPNFTFFGNTFKSIYIGDNGILSFREGIDYFIFNCYDIRGSVDDSMFIAPFWSEINPEMGGLVSYSVNSGLKNLEKAKAQVEAAFPSTTPYNMRWVFLATWLDVHPRGYSRSNTHCSNTFQAILTSDDTGSYVIFYYETLNWISGIDFDGNCSKPALGSATSGFYAGHEIHRGEIQLTSPASCTNRARELATTSNVGENGVWVYKVDKGLEVPKQRNIRKRRNLQAQNAKYLLSTAAEFIGQYAARCPSDGNTDNTPPIGTCPKPSTPCRSIVVNIIRLILKFIGDFSRFCWKKENPTPTTPKPTITAPPTSPSSNTQEPETTAPPTSAEDPTLTTKSPQTIPEICHKIMDLGILLDSSASIRPPPYEIAKAFVDRLASAFVPQSRLMFIYYSYGATLSIELDNTLTPEEISDVIRAAPYEERNTETGKAMTIAIKEMQAKRRPDTPQSMVILTDGVPSTPLFDIPQQAQDAGINVFAVGVGKLINMENLLEMAMRPDRVTFVEYYEYLEFRLKEVSKIICNRTELMEPMIS